MEVFITKFCLQRGIIKTTKNINGVNFMYKGQWILEDEYFLTKQAAILDAIERKRNKLIQLQNQLAKLENKNVTIIKEV